MEQHVHQHSESVWSRIIDNPKTFYLAGAFVSFILSVSLWFAGHHDMGLFVGIWVPSICSAGTLILSGGKDG